MAVRWVYNILFTVLFWVASPWLLIRLRRRGQWREGFGQRFGRYKPGLIRPKTPGRRRLWLHAVSVGEVNICLQFLHTLRERMRGTEFLVSATTNTGMAELRAKAPKDVTLIYFPIDCRGYVRRALHKLQPDGVILVEREIWPNFLWELQDRSIPLFLINGRISERSCRAYKRYAFLFRELLSTFDLVAAQTDQDARRLLDIGCREESLLVTGSMKFDAASAASRPNLNVARLLKMAGRAEEALVIVAGSTHNGEETLLARVTQQLRCEFPSLFLVLVPRHFERSPDISAQLNALGTGHLRRSSLDQSSAEFSTPDNSCLLVDSTGELTAFYLEADVVFVGKSICARGGQNPIEPAALGKAMIFGPNMQNFPGVTHQLVGNDAAVQVTNDAELAEALASLLRSRERRLELGRNALEVVRRNMGATQRTVELLVKALGDHPGNQPADS